VKIGSSARVLAFAGLALAACLSFVQAGGRSDRQAAVPPPPFWKEKPEKFRLTTGSNCLYQGDASSAVTVVQLFIPGGRNAVPEGRDGLAYLAARLAFGIPDFNLARDIMDQAVEMEIAVLEDCSVISLSCLSEKLEGSLRTVSQIIQNPVFTGVRIDGVKGVMTIFRKGEEDDAAETGHGAVLGALFSGRGYGSSQFGTEASLKALEKKDVTAYYGRYFVRDGILFSVCSDLDRETVGRLLEKYFTKFRQAGAEAQPSPAPPTLPANRDIVLDRGTKQTYVAKAFVLPAGSIEDWVKGYLLEVLLGKGQACRLWDIRSSRRLAYSVGAQTTWMRTCGLLEAWVETDNGKKAGAVAALDEVLGVLRDKGVTEDELAMSRTLAQAELLRTSETKKSRAQAMGRWEILGLRFDGLAALSERIGAVSADEMNAFIGRVLDPEKSISVAVGPQPKP